MNYSFPALITCFSLILFFILTFNVGKARGKYKIPAPTMTGDPAFERIVRVQQNTLEQLMLFLPALWLFAIYVSANWSAIIGVFWLLGRIAYVYKYYQSAESKKRFPAFIVNLLTTTILLVGAMIGIIIGL